MHSTTPRALSSDNYFVTSLTRKEHHPGLYSHASPLRFRHPGQTGSNSIKFRYSNPLPLCRFTREPVWPSGKAVGW